MSNNLSRRSISPRERDVIVKVWGGKCAYCKSTKEPFAIDHIVPFVEGGTCDLENLCLACVQCNSMKSDVRLPEMHEGLLLGIAKRKARSVRRKMLRKVLVAPKKEEGSELRLPTECGGEWVFPYLENAAKLVLLLESLLSRGMVEEIKSRGEGLPNLVLTKSGVLHSDFFEGIEISYHEACSLLSSVLHTLTTDAGWSMSNIGWGGIRNGDDYVIQFHRSMGGLLELLCFVKRSIVVYGDPEYKP